MTEVEIIGGPLDGQVLDTAGNPQPGEKLIHDGGVYRLTEGPPGIFAAVWRGWATVEVDRDLLGPELTDSEVAKLADALREHEAGRRRTAVRIKNALTLTVFGSSIGASAGVGLLIVAGLGSLIEKLAGAVGGWMNLSLALAVLAGTATLAAALTNWEDLDNIDDGSGL